jgi:hypothetical protein
MANLETPLRLTEFVGTKAGSLTSLVFDRFGTVAAAGNFRIDTSGNIRIDTDGNERIWESEYRLVESDTRVTSDGDRRIWG